MVGESATTSTLVGGVLDLAEKGSVGTLPQNTEKTPLLAVFQNDQESSYTSSLKNDDDDDDGLSLGSFDRDFDSDLVTDSTRSFVSLQRSLSGAWDSYNVALDRRPLIVKSITAAILLGLGDVCGQVLQVDTSKSPAAATLDWTRTARFALLGLLLQAPLSHYYYQWLDRVLPPVPKPFLRLSFYIKLAVDQLVQAPIFLLLLFCFLGTLEGLTPVEIKDQLQDDYVNTLIANWKLWLPAQTINIAFCPPHLRVLFLNVIFFVWSIVLSLLLNG